MSRIMQKEIKSEMNDFFFAKDHLDFYHEYVMSTLNKSI